MVGSPGCQCPASRQPIDHLAQLGGGHRGGVVGGAEPDRVQHRGPASCGPVSSAATNEYGQPGIICGVALGPAVDVAEQPLRAGRGVRAQPRADIHRQHDPVPDPRQRQRRPAPGAAGRSRSTRGSARRTWRRARGGARRPASARPASAPARRRTTPRRSARTAHPPARSSSRRTPAGTRQDHPAGPRCHPGRRPGPARTLPTTATVFVFELCERNPKRIKRWPYHVPPTRRSPAQPTQPGRSQVKRQAEGPGHRLAPAERIADDLGQLDQLRVG